MTKICVTGATGFIGSKLSLKLSQLSYDVLAPVRNLSSSSLSLNQNLQYIKVEKEDSNLNYSKILKQVSVSHEEFIAAL